MSNPYGDPVAGGTGASQNPYDDPVAEEGHSYLGASAISGAHGALAAGARLADAVNPFTLSEEDAAVLFKDDPAGFQKWKDSVAGGLTRFSQNQQNAATAAMKPENLSPEGQADQRALAGKEYATTDPSKSAFLSPEKMAGDVLQSLPSSALLGATAFFTRGVGLRAYEDALASGATQTAAKAAAAKAAGESMAKMGAGGEGALGYGQQAAQTRQEAEQAKQADLEKSPAYQELLKQGFTPEMAKTKLAAQTAEDAGMTAGAVDAVTNAAGGNVLGRVIGEGGTLLPRIGKGLITEGTTEAVQSAGEQVGANLATKQNLNPYQDPLEGSGEAAMQGLGVGGLTGGAVAGFAGHALHVAQDNENTLNHTAMEEQTRTATGGTTDENAAAAAFPGPSADPKPRLSPLQGKIVMGAAQMGLDPEAALTVAQLESGMNPAAKNPTSTAHGLFQQLDSVWGENGGGDRNDPGQQIANGLTGLAKTQADMQTRLKRNPSVDELYAGHLFGAAGGSRLVEAASMNPQGKLLDTVQSWAKDTATAKQILQSNGFSLTDTNEMGMNRLSGKVQKAQQALGLHPEINSATNATTTADTAPDTGGSDPELADLDAMFRAEEDSPLTPEDVDAALAEDVQMAGEPSVTGEAPQEETTMLDQPEESPAAPAKEAPQPPILPRELAAAAPRYAIGQQSWPVHFENDLDRAAYIIANNAKRSVKDTDYLAFVMQHTGMTEEEARSYGQDVRANIKELAKAAKGDASVTVLNLRDARTEEAVPRSESHVSLFEAGTRAAYDNPNDQFIQRPSVAPIVAGLPEAEGTPVGQVRLQPGQVVAAGVESDHTPLPYMQAAQQTVQAAIERFAPTARVVLTFGTEAKNAVSSYRQRRAIGNRTRSAAGRGLYQINLRNATHFGQTVDGTRNPTTQRKIVYATWHEIGHVIADEQMTQNMSPELKEKFQEMGAEGYFMDQELATLPVGQAAVLREYNDLKWRTLNDPTFTARQWAEAWLSPWKLSQGLGQAKVPGLERFVQKFLGEGWAQRLDEPAKDFALAVHNTNNSDILSPHEYMAEQMARYAYSNKLDTGTSLGAWNFFKQAIETMREFFKSLKKEGRIKPGTAFAEWMDSLTSTTEAIEDIGRADVTPGGLTPPTKGRTKKVRPAITPEVPNLLPPDPMKKAREAANLDPTFRAAQDEGYQFLLMNPDMQDIRILNPEKYGHLMDLLKEGRFEDFKTEVELNASPQVAARLRFDSDVAGDGAEQDWQEIYHKTQLVVSKGTGFARWMPNAIRKIREQNLAFLTLRQAAQKFTNIAGVQALNLHSINFKAFKAKLEMPAIDATQKVAKLGKEQYGLLEQALRDEHFENRHYASLELVNGTWRFMPSEQLRLYAKDKGLADATVASWLSMKNAHLSQMNALQSVLRKKIMNRYAGRPKRMKVKLKELAQQFQDIRSRPFLPQTRFGQYALQVLESGPDGDQVVHVEMFATRALRDETKGALEKIAGGRKVRVANYTLTSSILRTLPVQLINTWADEMGLTDMERKEIREQVDSITSNPQLRKYSNALARITGANKNMLSNFAEFSMHNANNISKLHYREHMEKAILQINADRIAAAELNNVSLHDELANVMRWANRYKDHILSPTNEFQAIRSFVVLHQLWGKVSTALMNLMSMTQLWALATRQQGAIRGTAKVAGTSGKIAWAGIQSAMNRVLRQPVEGAQVFDANTKWALDQAKSEGFLEESFAAQLADFAGGGTLERLNLGQANRLIKRVTWLGMQPMHVIDSFVRRVTFVHQFEQALRDGKSREQAYTQARGETYALQGDNSLINRPEFMRGKLGLFTVYYGYMQQMLYVLSGAPERARRLKEAIEGGKAGDLTTEQAKAKFYKTSFAGETMRTWMMWLALGGIMGLPGAEDLDKLLELISTKLFGHRFSLKEEAFKLADTIAAQAHTMGVDVNPRSIVHGTLSDVAGFDVSGSVGLGQALPGSGALQHLGGNDKGQVVLGAMGPFGSVVSQFLDLFGDDPSMVKRFGIVLPTAAGNVLKGMDAWEHGVRNPSGGRITIDMKTGQVRDLTTGENLGMLMGFQPSIVTTNKEMYWMQKDALTYWTTRRNRLMVQLFEAQRQGDREAIADVRKALGDFNLEAPRGMAITGRQAAMSLRSKARNVIRQEAGLGGRREMAQRMAIQELFREPD